MCFYGRKKELDDLNKAIESKIYPNALIYGRRRIGKSAIVSKYLENKNVRCIYYQCLKTTDIENCESLTSLIRYVFKDEYVSFSSFENAFDYLFSKSKEGKVILVLDEYSYWREVKNGFDTIVQRCLDKSKNSLLSVILCGSEISCMEYLDSEKYPLHGRFSLKLRVDPFDYLDASSFTPSLSEEEKAFYYACFGGTPFLLERIDVNKSLKENIIDAYLSGSSHATSFIETTLRDELSRIEYANAIISAIALGAKKYSDILSKSHVSTNVQMDRALKPLIALGIISREAPINDRLSEKKAIYSIEDNAIAFYYMFIFRNQSFLKSMSPSMFYDLFIERNLHDKFIPKVYEKMCKEFLLRQNKEGKLKEVFVDIGKYYYDDPRNKKNGEFDVVTMSIEGKYRSYEAKWWNSPVEEKIIEEERRKISSIPLAKDVQLGFFSKNGYTSNHGKDEFFFTLKDMY